MGHAAHFLTRVERLSARQADVALALYRDPGLVAFILSRVRLPDGAERVALALEHANSPHIIVTRAGAFVTCLGAGMTVSAAPVIARAQLDQMAEKFDVVRTALKRAEEGEESRRLFELLLGGGAALAREEFALLRAVVPVIGPNLMQIALKLGQRIEQRRQEYRRRYYRVRSPVVLDLLRFVWGDLWAVGHLAALCSSYIEDLSESLSGAEREQLAWALRPVLEVALTTLSPGTVLRAAWGAARIGRPFLSQYYDRLPKAVSFPQLTHVLVVLLSVALAHESVRAEVSEALEQNLARVEALADDMMTAGERKVWVWIHGHGRQMLAGHKHGEYVAEQRKLGARRIIELGAALPAGHPQRWDTPEQVPDELAMTALLSFDQSMLVASEHRILTFFALPWVTGAAADELYVPARYMEAYGGKFDADRTRDMLDRHARYHWIGQPVRAEERPGRNQPCSCGSGKKFKRCCGAGA
jgi:SEC-C motif